MTSAMPQNQHQDTPSPATDKGVHDWTPTGAILSTGEQTMAVLLRHGKPPLRFKGRRLTHHWTQLSPTMVIDIELWHQLSKGLVVSYSILSDGSIVRKSIQISDYDEAADCLENICANLDATTIKHDEFDGLWSALHLHLCFKQKFKLLVADVLSDWHVLPKLQEHA